MKRNGGALTYADIAWRKKPVLKGHKLYDFHLCNIFKITEIRGHINGCQGLGWWGGKWVWLATSSLRERFVAWNSSLSWL